ncbi:MAG: N-6 DNA methylase [bacterium]|nr:N-6 DNA methylase [bacterium]
MSGLRGKVSHLVAQFQSRARSGLSLTFGRSLASVLGWERPEELARAERVEKRDVPFDVTQAYLGEEPALLFFGHKGKHSTDVISKAALCGYHSAVEWGIVTNLAETVIFNSHWFKDGRWFCLPALTADQLARDSSVLEALTPVGLEQGRVEKIASREQEPDRRLVAVDENLVNSLDVWRDEALRYSSSPAEVDGKLQNVFAQLFVLRVVEDRGLAPSIPALETAIPRRGELNRDALQGIFEAAKSSIQSELFDSCAPGDVDDYVLEGIIHDLYYPKDFPVANVRYNFAWIDADVLGRAYEKYLSEVLVPVGRRTAQLSLFEEPLHDVERVSRQKAGGVYYTPAFIVRYLTGNSLDAYFRRAQRRPKEVPRVADISCGSGSFLTTCADALIRRLRKLDGKKNWGRELVRHRKLIGVDVDTKAVTLARLSLWLRLAEEPDPLPLPSLNKDIVCGDSLSENTWKGLPSRYDVIVGNPPFMPTPAVKEWRKFRGAFRSAAGRFDYSSLFVEKAVSLLGSGGLLGLVVPNRLFQNAYASPVREVLTEKTRLRTIIDFGSTEVFLGTSSYVGLLCAQRDGRGRDPARVRVVRVRALPARFPGAVLARGSLSATPVRAAEVRAYDAEHPQGGSPWVLLSQPEMALRVKLEDEGDELAGVAEIVQGIKTGANDVFVVEPGDGCAGPLCEIVNGMGNRHTIEAAILRPVVYGAEIRRYDSVRARRYLIYPYRGEELIGEGELRRSYSRTWGYLAAYQELLAARSGVNAGSYNWYGLVRRRRRTWLEMPKLVMRDLAMGPAFAIDSAGSTFLIGGMAVVPADPVLLEPLLGFLNSRLAAWYLGQVSPAFRGGFRKFEPQSVEMFPIPRWVTEPGSFQDELGNVVRQRLQAQLQGNDSLQEDIERRIDRLISTRIGVDLDEI